MKNDPQRTVYYMNALTYEVSRTGTGEEAQWSKAHNVLPEDLRSLLNTQVRQLTASHL